jgi:hypothetical protein
MMIAGFFAPDGKVESILENMFSCFFYCSPEEKVL